MATQRMLARDMVPWVAPLITDSGVCPDTPSGKQTCIENIDLACEALSDRVDSEGLLFDWYVPVEQGCFALPQECREARYIVLNGVPLRQRDEWYIGKVGNNQFQGGCSPAEVLDLGDFYIPTPLPKQRGIRIALVATSEADKGKVCTVQVVDEYGKQVKQDVVLKGAGVPSIMDSVAYDVTYFVKPKTVNTVLMQLAYDDGQRFQFCHYLPDTEEGLFRRKALPRRMPGCNMVKIKGKLRYVRITSEDQILPFNSRLAIGDAVAAVAAWRRKDTQAYDDLLAHALNELYKQMQDASSPRNVRQVTFLTQSANPSQAGNFGRCWN